MKNTFFSFLLLFFSFSLSAQKNNESYLLIGTYTSAGSEGIYMYRFNSADGSFSPVGSVKSSNPSFLAISPNERYVYAVNEDSPGAVTSYLFDKTSGKLKELNQQPSGGDHPCYITVHKSGKWVVAGNYTGGNLSVFPINRDGSLGAATDMVQHTGSSVNESRQEKAHVHGTFFSKDGKYLFVPDLGMDKVMVYSFDNKKGKLSPATMPEIMTEPGAGPRHLDFHPNGKYLYLLEELSGSVSVYALGKNAAAGLIQNISALPPEYMGPVGSADIHVSPDGKFLYCSNRGESNTIAIFSINASDGIVHLAGHQSTLGKTPRNFNFDPSGKFLLVANQNSDEIVIFERNTETGLLKDTGKRIQVSKPVCIKWISKN